MKHYKLKSLVFGFLVASAPLSVLADDTDIYNNVDALEDLGVRPNVLLMLDTSLSMTWGLDGGTSPATGDSRMEIMQTVLKTFLNDASVHGKLNIGLGRYNATGGSIIYPVEELDATSATTLISRLDNHMEPAGYTPMVPSFYESALYMLGRNVVGGLNRPDPGVGSRRNLRISHENSLTGGSWSHLSGCPAKDSSDPDCVDEAWASNPTYVSPVTHQCQANHVVLLTDGYANRNPATVLNGIKSIINASNPDAVSCTEHPTGDAGNDTDGTGKWCAEELASYLYNNDLFDDSTEFSTTGAEITQNVITHTIGFAFSDSWVQNIATAGGGSYFQASDSTDLSAAFSSLFQSFTDTNATFSAPSATVNQFNRLNHLDDIYFAVFHPENNKTTWPGNIKKYKLVSGTLDNGTPNDTSDDLDVANNTIVDRNTVPAIDSITGFFKPTSSDFWSTASPTEFQVTEGGAANQIPADTTEAASRKVYTWLGGNVPGLTDAVNEVSATNDTLTKGLLGVAAETDDYWTKLRKWMAGIDVLDWDGDAATDDYRQQMGDPLHSRPVVVTYGMTNGEPDLVMFFGTNDGYFRAIDGNGGGELFSFLPEEMLPDMKTRMENTSSTHLYGVDGAPTVWVKDVDQDGSIESADGDHVYVYFGFRRGGSSYYALDVTDVNNPSLLWRIQKTDADFAELGQTWSKPIKTKILYDTDSTAATNNNANFSPAEVDVLIFAGGYDTGQDDTNPNIHRRTDSEGRAIYMVRADTGALLWKTEAGSDATMAYSIPAAMSVIDPDLSGHGDQMYVGDMGGQIWRFDINNGAYWDGTGQLPSGFVTGQVIAELAANGSDANARRFYQSPDIAIIKENNQEKIAVTIGSGYRARPNETAVLDRFYMLKIPNPYEALGTFTALNHSNLLDVTNTLSPTFNNEQGWYIDLVDASGTQQGEKVLSTPLIVDGKIIFTTYEPTARLIECQVQPGTSREYAMKLLDGSPAFNQGGSLTTDDRSRDLKTGTIVDEPVVIFTEHGGGSTFLGTEKGTYGITNNRATRSFWFEKE